MSDQEAENYGGEEEGTTTSAWEDGDVDDNAVVEETVVAIPFCLCICLMQTLL